MIIKGEQKYIRMSSRKLRLVVDAIRDRTPEEAIRDLGGIRKKAAPIIAKTIKMAMANARNATNLQGGVLGFERIEVNQGPLLKRWRAVSRGRAHSIRKPTAHLKILLQVKPMKNDMKNKKTLSTAAEK